MRDSNELFEMKKYKLKDVYDGVETLGYFDTMAEVSRASEKRDWETDGEGEPQLLTLNPETRKYR